MAWYYAGTRFVDTGYDDPVWNGSTQGYQYVAKARPKTATKASGIPGVTTKWMLVVSASIPGAFGFTSGGNETLTVGNTSRRVYLTIDAYVDQAPTAFVNHTLTDLEWQLLRTT